MAQKPATPKQPSGKEAPLLRKIVVDVLGVLLIIASILFGWLPGVGGIPLFLAGLSLLATNHEWARRILENVKQKGTTFMQTIFRDHPVLVIVYDIAAIALLVTAGLTLGAADGNFGRGFASIMAFFGMGLLIGNRQRITKINNFVRNVTRRSR